MPEQTGRLTIETTSLNGFQLHEEHRSNAGWLVARNFTARFRGLLQLPNQDIRVTGVFLTVENALLPVQRNQAIGYSHGVVSIYNEQQAEIFTGPFLKPVVGMIWEKDSLVEQWTRVIASWSGSRDFAGHLLHLELEGELSLKNQEKTLIEEGSITLLS